MTKLDFIKLWLSKQWYAEKAAIQSIISIQVEDPKSLEILKGTKGAVFVENKSFFTIIDGQTVKLEGDVKEPFYVMDDIIKIPGDFHPMLKGQGYTTTFGLLLFNVILFWEVFGELVEYKNEEFTDKLIKSIISSLMVDDPKEGEEVPPGKASVKTCLKFSSHACFLEGLGSYFIRTPGLAGLTPSPTVLARKKVLFDKLKEEGNINKPVYFTKALKELVDMDMEEQMASDAASFYIEKKFIDNARKRMFIAFGIEPSASGEGWIALPMSLDEGMDPNYVADYINTAVVGSYSRSMATGEGGAKVKDYLKIVGRRIVAEEECGTLYGESILIDKTSYGNWINSFALINGKTVLITKEIIDKYMDKRLLIRTTNYCLTPDDNYCYHCCGVGLGSNKEQLSAEAVRIPTNNMLQKMSAQHISGSKVVTLDLEIAIK